MNTTSSYGSSTLVWIKASSIIAFQSSLNLAIFLQFLISNRFLESLLTIFSHCPLDHQNVLPTLYRCSLPPFWWYGPPILVFSDVHRVTSSYNIYFPIKPDSPIYKSINNNNNNNHHHHKHNAWNTFKNTQYPDLIQET